MFDDLLQSQFVSNMVQGWIRHGATAAAGYLLAQGIITSNQTDNLIGSLIFLGAVAWSGAEKYLAKKNVQKAVATAKG